MQQIEMAKGCITKLVNVLVGGSTVPAIERKMGFKPSYLKDGYRLLVLSAGQKIVEGEFEYCGYTYMYSGKRKDEKVGVPQDSDKNMHDHFEEMPERTPLEQKQKEDRMDGFLNLLNAGGNDRMAKVVPINFDHLESKGEDFDWYKVGSGVIQFELKKKKQFDVVATVLPGQELACDRPGLVRVVDSK